MKLEIEIDERSIHAQVQAIADRLLSSYYSDRYGRPTEDGRALASLVAQEIDARSDQIRETIARVVEDGLDAAVEAETVKAMKRVAKAKVKAAEQLGMLEKED